MSSSSLMCSSLVVLALFLISNSFVLVRSAEGATKLSSSSSSSPSGLASLVKGHNLVKRATDMSCKGAQYDIKLFEKLDRVCEDCYNLYRKPFVAIECRRNCFGTSVFRQCVAAQLLDVEEHVDIREAIAEW
uniref:Hyperglycemic hormone n=1 Tax=Pandalus japonicus TaxID=666362 RepID=H9T7R4_PANJP|nr:hyperglycemic hormone [Pandalus japonicus]